MVGKGNFIAQKMPYDFFFIHRATGRAIALDAKSSADETKFSLSESNVKQHQKLSLIEAGQNGIIAGLLIECREGPHRGVCWLGHGDLAESMQPGAPKSVPWTSQKLMWLATSGSLIDLSKLLRR